MKSGTLHALLAGALREPTHGEMIAMIQANAHPRMMLLEGLLHFQSLANTRHTFRSMNINVGFRLEPGQSREITVTTAKSASTISARDLVNYEEAAEILGLSLQTVRIYKIKDPDFPEPITDTRSPVWRRSDIVAYKERRASKRKRERSLSGAAAAKRARSESGRKPKPAASEIDFSQLVTVEDIAEILGVTTQTVRKYSRADPEFPEPFYVKKTHWWRRDEILVYQEYRASLAVASAKRVSGDDANAPA